MDLETPEKLLSQLHERAGGRLRVYVCGGPAEPLFLKETFEASPDLAAGVTFIGAWLPGINQTDWTAFHPQSQAETSFMYPAHHAAHNSGRLAFHPLHYSATAAWLSATPLDAAFIPVSAPNAEGRVSFSLASDFGPLLAARTDVFRIAVVKPDMPLPVEAPGISMSEFDAVIEDPTPLLRFADNPLSETSAAIAGHIAGELSDGDTVQSGIGNIQQMAMSALSEHRKMCIHTGMVSSAVTRALATGAIVDEPHAIVTGTAIGSPQLYAQCAIDHRMVFRPVTFTHAVREISRIPCFTAINGAIEVDLFGQVNSEWVGGRQVSATGGVADFVRGAQLAKNGRSIIALPATTKRGDVSRIVPVLSSPTVTLPRADTDLVVTEHGVARLKYLSNDARAEALIAIAAPEHRAALSAAWAKARTGAPAK